MANALGTLFGEIAGAIREKTGDTATMKPAEFPEKIAAIEGGGSGGDSKEPLIKYISTYSTTSGAAVSTHTLSFRVSKNTKVLAAWKGYQQSNSGYPNISSLEDVPLSELTVDRTNANYDSYTMTIKFELSVSGTYNKTIFAKLLVTVPNVTVTSRGDGFYDGKLEYIESTDYPVRYSDERIYATMLFKNFSFFDGCTTIPVYLLCDQMYLESVDLSNITSIKESAFKYCTSLKSINLRPDLTELGSEAFAYCSSLTGELVIPPNITALPYICFAHTKFDRVVFHGGITAFGSAGSGAFDGCTHPTVYDFTAFTSVPKLGGSAWLGKVGNGQVLRIPAALFDTWSTSANWSSWASQMVAV